MTPDLRRVAHGSDAPPAPGRGGVRITVPLLLVALLAGGCGGDAQREPTDALPAAVDTLATPPLPPAPIPLPVDSMVEVAPLGEAGWEYGRGSEIDLDGDGVPERLIVAARAEVERGRPLWDDGQPWQVYIEEPSGERTLLFARYVQLGSVFARATLGEGAILIVEHLPDRLQVHEIDYGGPGEATVRTKFERLLDPLGELASPMLP